MLSRRIVPLRIGLIGCGRIAQLVHLHTLTHLREVELAAIAEIDPQRLADARKRVPQVPAFADYGELLALSDLDAVVISLPNTCHAPAAIAAFEQGKHVYLEKPLATNFEDADAILTAWRSAGKVGMIGFNYRFNPLFQSLRQHIQAAKVGKLVTVRSVFSTAQRTVPKWQQERVSGGGVLFDLALHHIDLIHFFFGQPVREVGASLSSQNIENDSAVIQMRLADGLLVQSFFSMSAVQEHLFEIYGQRGKLTADLYRSLDVGISDPRLEFARLKRLWRNVRSITHAPYIVKKIRSAAHEPSYRAAMRHFVRAARGEVDAMPDLTDGYKSLAVVLAAEDSAQTGQIVNLSDSRE